MRMVSGDTSVLRPVLALHYHSNTQVIRMSHMARHCVTVKEPGSEFTKSFPITHHLFDDAAKPPCCLDPPPLLPRIFGSKLGSLLLGQNKLLKDRYHVVSWVRCDLDQTSGLLMVGERGDIAQGNFVLIKARCGILRISQ